MKLLKIINQRFLIDEIFTRSSYCYYFILITPLSLHDLYWIYNLIYIHFLEGIGSCRVKTESLSMFFSH